MSVPAAAAAVLSVLLSLGYPLFASLGAPLYGIMFLLALAAAGWVVWR